MTSFEAITDAVPYGLLIANQWRESTGGRQFGVDNPATGDVIAKVADAGVEDALQAVAAAEEARIAWAETPPRHRGEILRKALGEITRRAEDFAQLITLEMGKPLAEARAEVAYAADFVRWYAEESVRIEGTWAMAPGGGQRLLTFKQPVGVCLLITPWNFPMAMATRKIAPAVAAGCTMVVKPAEDTPLTTLLLADILVECGLPAGVLNVLTTSNPGEVVGRLLHDSRIRKLSFTGSTEVGRELIKRSANQVMRLSMELGGNAPFLVFADADIDLAIEGAIVAKMRNIGQACTAANRFYVHSSIVDEFSERLAARMSALTVGPGQVDGVEVGPLINSAARDRITALVDDAVARGSQVLTGGKALDGKGFFYQPTVLRDVPADAQLQREEIFGPVAPISAFDVDGDAIRLANDTSYGLVAYVYTRDLARAVRVSERLEVGMVGLNQGMVSNAAAPFGGVKHSGFGREGSHQGLDEYLETKLVAMRV